MCGLYSSGTLSTHNSRVSGAGICEACFEKDKSLVGSGHDLVTLSQVPSAEACQWRCQQDNSCAYFTYFTQRSADTGQWKKCYLKRDTMQDMVPLLANEPGAVSGAKKCL